MKYIPGFKFTIKSNPIRSTIQTLKTLRQKIVNVDHVIPELTPNVEYEIYRITPKIENGITTSVTYTFRSRKGETKVEFNTIGDAETKIDKILGIKPTQQKEESAIARENIVRDLGKVADRYFNR